eukprot:TRINITY_DN23199_c0_g1_i1.p1 TRINITY_DN23199_c0_g1~~TRINITY_DN23199_c0_g1_i1.p1  ORF type:complete len:144 (-),score=37.43 TRINITY_DN23199_c0_g1_i1:9-440(-)
MNILRCYAIYNTNIVYCQGMNFVAGFFYLIYRDERVAFVMFASLMKQMNLAGFYQQNIPLAERYIYQINRLLAVYLPGLHRHFFDKGINCAYFCTSWFLTSFCYALQFESDGCVPPFLLALSLIHICRCRRYAVCRSRWSPYH